LKLKFGVYYEDADAFYLDLQDYLNKLREERSAPKANRDKEMHAKMAAIVLKGKDIKATSLAELKKPKSRWELLKNLEQLSKKFPLDQVLRVMIRNELRETKLPQNSNEYDTADPADELLRK
jgi:hypothetical protein